LVHQGQVLTRTPTGSLERRPNHPFHAERRVDADLGRDLVSGELAQYTAVARVRTLGAFAINHEVDGRVPGQWAGHSGVELGRAQVHVVVEFEPQPQQQSALENAGRDRRITYGAEQDRVVLAEFFEHGVRQSLAGAVPQAGTQVELSLFDSGQDGVEYSHRLLGYLDPDPVAGNYRELHVCPLDLCDLRRS